jgi:hypothetical protein
LHKKDSVLLISCGKPNEVGSTFLARVDGRPCLGSHVKPLCGRIADRVEPRIKDVIKDVKAGEGVPHRELVLDSVTKDELLAYRNDMKTEKIRLGTRFWSADTPSLYYK